MGNYFSSNNEPAAGDELALRIKRQSAMADAKEHDNFKDFPFWFGYLPDKDVKFLLNYRNEFLLRKLEVDDALCLTICLSKNKVDFNYMLSKILMIFRSMMCTLKRGTLAGDFKDKLNSS